jgi:hypothetical protein
VTAEITLEQCERTFPKFQPRALRGIRLAVQQSSGALKPAVGHGMLAAKRPVVPGQPDGDTCCPGAIVARPE